MPRKWQKKDGPGGRPAIDDTPLAQGVLFAFHIEGHEKDAVLQWAVKMLKKQRQEAADAAPPGSKRDGSIGHDAARRRVNEAVASEWKAQGGYTPLAGLPPSGRAAGMALAEIARRDGYTAGRAALLQAMTWAVFGIFEDEECVALIDRWISIAEAEISTD